MKIKYRRIIIIFIVFLIFSNLIGIVLLRLQDNISFFYTVTEVVTKKLNDKIIRIGGIVCQGSVKRDLNTIKFKITDLKNIISVVYIGILPPLFAENSNVVIKGKMTNNIFFADEVLAKHDENYIPRKYKVLLTDSPL